MSNTIVSQKSRADNIQTAQPYHCPECGQPVPPRHVHRYVDYLSPRAIPKPLDEYAKHLEYLNCKACGRCTRVARLGNAVLPFDWPNPCDAETEARTIAEALVFLAGHVPAAENDPAARIVYRLLARQVTPAEAIRSIHDLAEAAIEDVLELGPGVAMPVFEEVAR